MTAMERFKAKTIAGENGCVLWVGCRFGAGYGQFWVGRKAVRAHRWLYEQTIGPVPDGLVLDHLCRTKNCVNPTHLEPVTIRDNVLRGIGPTAIHAKQTHCKRGHEFSADNTIIRKTPAGRNHRQCRICLKILWLAIYHRKARKRRSARTCNGSRHPSEKR